MAARDDAGEAFAAEPQVGEPRLEVWVDSDLKGHLAWAIEMDAGSLTEPDARRYWVAAVGEPTVLNWESPDLPRAPRAGVGDALDRERARRNGQPGAAGPRGGPRRRRPPG